MKWIFAWNKKMIFYIALIIVMVSFIVGFFMGDRFGETVPVLNKRLVPIYKVKRDDKKIAITLDGTWGADYTDEILKIFDENNLDITFFFAGYWLENYPDLVKKIAAEGHEIGNHTYTHPHCNSLSSDEIRNELERTSSLIEKLTGKRPQYFRPPFGEYNNNIITTSRENGYQVVQWSLDSLDWREPGTEFIVNRIMSNVTAGDIILMHNNAPDTPEALRTIIPRLKSRGFEIVPLSELIYSENYYIQSHDGLQVRQSGSDE